MKIAVALLTLGCFSLASSANPPVAPPGQTSAVAADVSKSNAPLMKKGKVLSSLDAKSFTYIEIQDGSRKLWVVAPTIAVKPGSTISYADAQVQAKYFSAGLNRELNNVLFTNRVSVDK